jgi:hypothetical protein
LEARERRDYLNTNELLQEAIEVANLLENCTIEHSEALSLKQQISSGVGYQMQLKMIDSFIEQMEFDTAMVLYAQLGEYWKTEQLERLQIQHDSLHLFALTNQKFGLLNYLIQDFAQHQEFEQALTILNQMFSAGVPAKETASAQLTLGQILAESDFRQNSGADLSAMLRKYQNGSDWFVPFRLAYRERWLQLKKNSK